MHPKLRNFPNTKLKNLKISKSKSVTAKNLKNSKPKVRYFLKYFMHYICTKPVEPEKSDPKLKEFSQTC